MSGVKGRSGRGTHRSDVIRNEVIQKSWEIARDFLNNAEVAVKDKLELVAKIIVKAMPNTFEGEVPETKIIIMRSADKKTSSVIDHEVSGGRLLQID